MISLICCFIRNAKPVPSMVKPKAFIFSFEVMRNLIHLPDMFMLSHRVSKFNLPYPYEYLKLTNYFFQYQQKKEDFLRESQMDVIVEEPVYLPGFHFEILAIYS